KNHFLIPHSSFLIHRLSLLIHHSSLYLMPDLQTLNRESLVRLTVRGRKSGKPHTVKIWFTSSNGKTYVTSPRGRDADWVMYLRKNPIATLQIGATQLQGTATWREDARVRAEILPLF